MTKKTLALLTACGTATITLFAYSLLKNHRKYKGINYLNEREVYFKGEDDENYDFEIIDSPETYTNAILSIKIPKSECQMVPEAFAQNVQYILLLLSCENQYGEEENWYEIY